MGEVIQLRDYQRKEERSPEIIQLAREIMGRIEDTAPCEMPYEAPERDPA